ncbi:leucine-rich repeat protein [Anaerocolumna xylanovorans]|uniref:Fibronectin type III domain-containing protein n=1 Tax=Anaerocolumna xylanovorans DSM 12503 TaxID=1121345 RepID=A0A1M7YJ86_9FIRM|nr:leucine-rich repeat protein [Anaerocolumna xylanovorans]SHO52588.1 Fibronectin type III domain-containing protein [Anaerocolumna xylanovorans DSM 12503]
MKKSIQVYILVFVSMFLLALIVKPVHIKAAVSKDGNWEYWQDDGRTYISPKSDKVKKGAVTIPSKVDGHTITAIGGYAFWDCTELTGITMPDTVTMIDSQAFRNCENLKSISLSKNLQLIADHAFHACTSLTHIELPDSLTCISTGAFDYCENLEEVKIPGKIKILYDGIFGSCYSLKKVIIPNSVTVIEENVFFECKALESISLPSSLKSIGEGAFSRCEALKTIKLPESVTSIGEDVFSQCSSLKSITIPSKIKTISDSLFYDCSSLTDVKLPEKLKGIEKGAFSQCTGLTHIDLPESLGYIMNYAFLGCTALKSIELPKNLHAVYGSAFCGCISLESVKAPGITAVMKNTFYNCKSLTSITLPDNLKYIEEDAFWGCDRLTVVFCGKKNKLVRRYEFRNDQISFIDPAEDLDRDAVKKLFLDNSKIPDNMKASNSGYDSIKLSWEFVGDASGYQIYRAASLGGKYNCIKNTASTEYVNTGLLSGNTYYYKVRAFKYMGSIKVLGNFTEPVSAVPVLAAPANLKTAAYGGNGVKISWNKTGGASGYQIYAAASQNGPYKWLKTTPNSYYVYSGKKKGSTLYFQVRGIRYAGEKKLYSRFSVTAG